GFTQSSCSGASGTSVCPLNSGGLVGEDSSTSCFVVSHGTNLTPANSASTAAATITTVLRIEPRSRHPEAGQLERESQHHDRHAHERPDAPRQDRHHHR